MDEPSRATRSLGARRVSDSPVIELIATDPRAARVVLGLFAVQLLMSIRFFFKYADARPGVLYGLFVVAALGACGVVLNVRRLLVFFTRPWVFVMGLTSLFLLVLFAYPRADALKEVGRGSDQDDCVRTLVGNVFALKEPYGFGYFGDPCSTGPTEFFVYFPVQVFSQYFIVVPVLSVLLGYWVLNQVTDRPTAIFLSLSQFASWLFLELSAVGSDLIVIGWLFAAATVASRRGMRNGNKALLVAGGVAYCLFAGSRVPLILVGLGSMWVLLIVYRARALRVVLPATVGMATLYLGSYAVAPSSFRPWHLVAKSGRIIRYLGGDNPVPLLVLLAAAGAILVISMRRGDIETFLDRQYFAANLALVVLPMAAVAAWDLSRHDFNLAAWEGLGYLFLCVPSLLVLVSHQLQSATDRQRQPISELS
jgi:hypothetical protein